MHEVRYSAAEMESRRIVTGEINDLVRATERTADRLDKIEALARDRLGSGRRLDQYTVGRLDQRLREFQIDNQPVIETSVRSRPRALRERDIYVDGRTSYLVADPRGYFQIQTSRTMVTMDSLSILSTPSPVGFIRHFAERVRQRSTVDPRKQSLRQIGTEITRSAGLISMCLRPAAQLPDGLLALPFRDGLMLGQIGSMPTDSMVLEIVSPGSVRNLEVEPAYETCDYAPDCAFDMTRQLTYTAKTFIGPKEMQPVQRYFRDQFLKLTDRFGPVLDRMRDLLFYPELPGYEPTELPPVDAETWIGMRKAVSAAIDILTTSGCGRAMGNSDNLRRRPANVYDEIESQLRMEREMELMSEQGEIMEMQMGM